MADKLNPGAICLECKHCRVFTSATEPEYRASHPWESYCTMTMAETDGYLATKKALRDFVRMAEGCEHFSPEASDG